jgi:hypothetical protein
MGKTKKMRLRTRVWAQAPKPSSFAEKEHGFDFLQDKKAQKT